MPPAFTPEDVGADASIVEASHAPVVAGEEPLVDRGVAAGDAKAASHGQGPLAGAVGAAAGREVLLAFDRELGVGERPPALLECGFEVRPLGRRDRVVAVVEPDRRAEGGQGGVARGGEEVGGRGILEAVDVNVLDPEGGVGVNLRAELVAK